MNVTGFESESRPKPRVSVVIPTYGRGTLVLETLRSVFAQTLADLEIIVVNDGSPDDTRAILSPLSDAGRITYLEQVNQGVARARNAGIARAQGQYVALLDDDDLWPPDKLEWQARFLDEHPDVGVVGGTLHGLSADGSTTPLGGHFPQITFESLFSGNPFWSPGQTLVRAPLLKELGGLNATIWGADDWDLWFRVARRSTIVMLERVSLHYRVHDTNASKQSARMLGACCATIERHLRSVAPARKQPLRSAGHHNMYGTYGALLADGARRRFADGDLPAALRELWGLRPLWRGAFSDRELRWRIARDLGLTT